MVQFWPIGRPVDAGRRIESDGRPSFPTDQNRRLHRRPQNPRVIRLFSSQFSRVASERRWRQPALGKAAALPRLPRRRARSLEGECVAVEVAAGGVLVLVWAGSCARVCATASDGRNHVRTPTSGGARVDSCPGKGEFPPFPESSSRVRVRVSWIFFSIRDRFSSLVLLVSSIPPQKDPIYALDRLIPMLYS